jgi:hypothetical protein
MQILLLKKFSFFREYFMAIFFCGKSFENVCPIVNAILMCILCAASLYFARELVLRWRLWRLQKKVPAPLRDVCYNHNGPLAILKWYLKPNYLRYTMMGLLDSDCLFATIFQ